ARWSLSPAPARVSSPSSSARPGPRHRRARAPRQAWCDFRTHAMTPARPRSSGCRRWCGTNEGEGKREKGMTLLPSPFSLLPSHLDSILLQIPEIILRVLSGDVYRTPPEAHHRRMWLERGLAHQPACRPDVVARRGVAGWSGAEHPHVAIGCHLDRIAGERRHCRRKLLIGNGRWCRSAAGHHAHGTVLHPDRHAWRAGQALPETVALGLADPDGSVGHCRTALHLAARRDDVH